MNFTSSVHLLEPLGRSSTGAAAKAYPAVSVCDGPESHLGPRENTGSGRSWGVDLCEKGRRKTACFSAKTIGEEVMLKRREL